MTRNLTACDINTLIEFIFCFTVTAAVNGRNLEMVVMHVSDGFSR